MQGIAQRFRDFQALFRSQECADGQSLSVTAHRELALVFRWIIDLYLEPSRFKMKSRLAAFRIDPSHLETVVTKAHTLVPTCGPVIEPEHDVDQQEFDATKPEDGPCSQEHENQSCAEHEYRCYDNQQSKAAWTQAAMRM